MKKHTVNADARARLATEVARDALGPVSEHYRHATPELNVLADDAVPYGAVLLTAAPPPRDDEGSDFPQNWPEMRKAAGLGWDAEGLLIAAFEVFEKVQFLGCAVARGDYAEGEGPTSGPLATAGKLVGVYVWVTQEDYVQAQAALFARGLNRRIDEERHVFIGLLQRPGTGMAAALDGRERIIAWEAERDLWNRLAYEGNIVGVLAQALHMSSIEYADVGDASQRFARLHQSHGAAEFLRRARTRPGYSPDEALHAMLNRAAY